MTSQITLNLNAERVRTNTLPRYSAIAARVSFAMLIFSLALNATLNLVPAPTVLPQASTTLASITENGYMFRLIMDMQSVVSVTLLANRFAHVVILILFACFSFTTVWCVRCRFAFGRGYKGCAMCQIDAARLRTTAR